MGFHRLVISLVFTVNILLFKNKLLRDDTIVHAIHREWTKSDDADILNAAIFTKWLPATQDI